METILDVAQLVLGLAAIVLLALKHGPSKRSLRATTATTLNLNAQLVVR